VYRGPSASYWPCVTLFRMSGSRNARKGRGWPPDAKTAEKLLRRFRAQMDTSGPSEVSRAARRLEVSMVGDRVPDPEDLALVMIYLLGARQAARRAPQSEIKSKKSARQAHRWDQEPPKRQKKRTQRVPESRPAPSQTGFSRQMEAQEDPKVAEVRSRLRAPRSRVRSDGSGRRIVVLGDGQD